MKLLLIGCILSHIILFYDSSCPLCLHEVRMLEKRNTNNTLLLVDLHNEKDLAQYPQVDKDKALAVLHAQTSSGDMVFGLDATHAAWSAVGLGYLSAPLRWPLIRYIADFFYRVFISKRHSISRLLTGKAYCSNNTCGSLKKAESSEQ